MSVAGIDRRSIGFITLCLSAALVPPQFGCQTPAPDSGDDTAAGGDREGDGTGENAKGGAGSAELGGGGSKNRGGGGSQNRGGSSTSNSAKGGGAGSSAKECTPEASGARPHEAGNYDNRSCNATGCHTDMVGGGWVYASAKGVPWIGGATITLTNTDGTTVTATSAEDGFFEIKGKVLPHYTACVSKCPGTDCSRTDHPNADCQTSNCHGKPTQRVYVSQNGSGGSSGAGGSSGGGDDCTPAASGGPYTHSEFVYGNQPCSGSGCHSDPKPVFMGGYLYDGITSTKTVPEATITLTQGDDPPVTAITGPDGMFFFGTVGAESKATTFKAPYTACVSKCPLTLCSKKDTHTTTEDCQSSNCHGPDNKIYLE